MAFWENLPDQCPPAAANDIEITEAYRLVGANPPVKEHFASHAKLGKKMPPIADACAWASCSLFTSLDAIRNLPSLPKIRANGYSHVAKLSVPTGAGLSLQKKCHVDFWMYDTFDPTVAVVTVEPI